MLGNRLGEPFSDRFAILLRHARGGSSEALGQLLQLCRPRLYQSAKAKLGPEGLTKETPSDVVQETMLDAHRDFSRFAGRSEPELVGWMQAILDHNVLNSIRRFRGTAKRNPDLERPIDGTARGDSGQGPAADQTTPSAAASRKEERQRLERALSRIKDEHATVIRLRYHEDLSFAEVAARLGRSEEAARKLWSRAIEALSIELGLLR